MVKIKSIHMLPHLANFPSSIDFLFRSPEEQH